MRKGSGMEATEAAFWRQEYAHAYYLANHEKVKARSAKLISVATL